MGWFGVSDSANRHNNMRSMAIDLNNTLFLKNTTGQILSATDYQLGRADTLAGVVGSQPSTQSRVTIRPAWRVLLALLKKQMRW